MRQPPASLTEAFPCDQFVRLFDDLRQQGQAIRPLTILQVANSPVPQGGFQTLKVWFKYFRDWWPFP